MSNPLILYVKTGCPWCEEAEAWLKAEGYSYELRDVNREPEWFAEMKRISSQTKAPTLEIDGLVLADFGVDELELFLEKNEILP